MNFSVSSRLGPRLLSRTRLAIALVLVSVVAPLLVAAPAHADYPSWQDVQKAKASEASAAAEATRLEGLLGTLQDSVDSAQREAAAQGTALATAEAAFDNSNIKARTLTNEAEASQRKAAVALKQAGTIAAQLYRSRGGDLTASLMLSGNNAGTATPERLLTRLGVMSKLTQQARTAYESAVIAKNTASSLANKAQTAVAQRDKNRVAAQTAFHAAVDTATAASTALAQQTERADTLQAQIAALRDTSAKTTEQYQAGVAARAAAAKTPVVTPSQPSGSVTPTGWAVPAYGPITDGFGPRVSPGGIGSTNHLGIDIGASCGSPIYAAHGGTVAYAGVLGTYGNFILLRHSDGVDTGYAHIMPGGIQVGIGQSVQAGQVIAFVGRTGASTGCHLHYEVRVNGEKIDGVPFMKQRGAALG